MPHSELTIYKLLVTSALVITAPVQKAAAAKMIDATKVGVVGGFENITISHCQISNTKMAGIALYAVDGGDLRHISISDVTMDGVVVPISIRLGARLNTFREGDSPKPTPSKLRDGVIQNVSAKNVEMIGMLIN